MLAARQTMPICQSNPNNPSRDPKRVALNQQHRELTHPVGPNRPSRLQSLQPPLSFRRRSSVHDLLHGNCLIHRLRNAGIDAVRVWLEWQDSSNWFLGCGLGRSKCFGEFLGRCLQGKKRMSGNLLPSVCSASSRPGEIAVGFSQQQRVRLTFGVA